MEETYIHITSYIRHVTIIATGILNTDVVYIHNMYNVICVFQAALIKRDFEGTGIYIIRFNPSTHDV